MTLITETKNKSATICNYGEKIGAAVPVIVCIIPGGLRVAIK